MNNRIKKSLIGIIKYVLWPLGALLVAWWIYANWAEPTIVGFDKQMNYAQGPVQVWVVRSFYIYLFLYAGYRSYAELGDRFDLPYELLPATIAFLAPLLLVMAIVQFQWFV